MTTMQQFFSGLFLLSLFCSSPTQCLLYTGRFNNYTNHPCIRKCSSSSSRMICEYDWTLEMYSTSSRACYNCPHNYTDCLRENCIFADGIKKTIEVVNKLLPGPAIQVCQGDTIVVNLNNMVRSERVTSIHWHGVRQIGTPYMDGVGMVTQCPIVPHTSFQYRFSAQDLGTHFWHSHSGVQRGDGVFGALIIRPNIDSQAHLYDFDLPEHYLIVIEWTTNAFQADYGPYTHSAYFLKEQNILINGKGALTQSPNYSVPLATYSVKKGFRYRFRFIHAGIQDCAMSISVENHNLTVIASDGNPLEPVEVESLLAFTGERYDFVVNANANQLRDYWIKVRGEGDCYWNELSQRAILRYDRALELNDPTVLNSSEKWTYEDSHRAGLQLRSFKTQFSNEPIVYLDKIKYGGSDKDSYFHEISRTPNKKFYLNMDLVGVDDPEFQQHDLYPYNETLKFKNVWESSVINNIKFKMPHMPPLYNWDNLNKLMICNSLKDQACLQQGFGFCECVHILEVDLNDLVEIIIIDGSSYFQNHPAHLHGHHFAVLGVDQVSNIISWNDTGLLPTELVQKLDAKGLLKRNFDKPLLKDTIVFPTHGYAILRFIADNPGYWLFHCHLDSHSDSGMMILFKVGQDKDLPAKPNNWPTCGSFSKFQQEQNELNSNFLQLIVNFFTNLFHMIF